jgi:hypothetical protein
MLFDFCYLPIRLPFILFENIRIRHTHIYRWSLDWLNSMTNCKKPFSSILTCSFIYVYNYSYIHCCRYPLMDCLNSLFYFLLYNAFIRSGLYFVYTYIYVQMYVQTEYFNETTGYCIISCYIHARARHYCIKEKGRGKNNTHKFRSGYTISNTIVLW